MSLCNSVFDLITNV